MSERNKSNRREFLKGRSALQSVREVVAGSPLKQPTEIKGEEQRGAGTHLLTFTRQAMGCQFEFVFNQGQYKDAGDIAVEMSSLVTELESAMSIYDPLSEISKLNNAPIGKPVPVSKSVYECLKLAASISVQTDGAFDITSGTLTQVWGFQNRKPAIPDSKLVDDALKMVGYPLVSLDDREQTVLMQKEGVKVNLGAIGKGFTLDRCAELARSYGIDNLLIHGGQSSVVAIGNRQTPSGEVDGWTVGITHPANANTRLDELNLCDECLATSGSARQAFFHEGKKLSHIIDPRTGWPGEKTISVTVVCETAAEADAFATAFCLMDLESISKVCNDRSDMSAIVTCEEDGHLITHQFGQINSQSH